MHLLHEVGVVQPPPPDGSTLQKHSLGFQAFFPTIIMKEKKNQQKQISNQKHSDLKLQQSCPTLLFNLPDLAYCLFKDGAFVRFDVEVIDVTKVS